MEAINSAITESGSGGVLPTFGAFMGFVELLLRVAVMAGPLLLLGFGLIFLLAPPKEANYGVGYRFGWGMVGLAAWKFTQRLAGMVWSALGAVLTIVMAFICNGFRDLEAMDMASRAGTCVLWELCIIVAACIAINITVMVRFDKDGFLRKETEE